jgi:hypothetical protein
MRGRRGTEIFFATFKDTTIPVLVAYVRNLSKPEVRLFYGAPVLILVFAAPGVVEEYDCAARGKRTNDFFNFFAYTI